jgi:hypothetical protein
VSYHHRVLAEDSVVPDSATPVSTAHPAPTVIDEDLAHNYLNEDHTSRTIPPTKKSTRCDQGAALVANPDSRHPPTRMISGTVAVTHLSLEEAALILVEAASMHHQRTTTISHVTTCLTAVKTSTHNATPVSQATAEAHLEIFPLRIM